MSRTLARATDSRRAQLAELGLRGPALEAVRQTDPQPAGPAIDDAHTTPTLNDEQRLAVTAGSEGILFGAGDIPPVNRMPPQA